VEGNDLAGFFKIFENDLAGFFKNFKKAFHSCVKLSMGGRGGEKNNYVRSPTRVLFKTIEKKKWTLDRKEF